jgi:hypothetical protein
MRPLAYGRGSVAEVLTERYAYRSAAIGKIPPHDRPMHNRTAIFGCRATRS